MPEYITFKRQNQSDDLPPVQYMQIPAVIVEADDEQAAVTDVVDAGALPARGGDIEAVDLEGSVLHGIETSTTVKAKEKPPKPPKEPKE